MADVQLEHGYTRLANELLEALSRAALPGARHFQVMLAMVRLLYGYNRAEDRIASSQVAAISGLDVRNVRSLLSDLVRLGLLECDGAAGRTPIYRIQKDHEKWAKSGRRQPGLRTTRVTYDPAHVRPGGRVTYDPGTRVTYDPDQRQKDSSPKTAEARASERTGRSTPKAPKARTASQQLVGAFCEIYREVRSADARPNGRDGKAVKEMLAVSPVTPEQLKAAARIYFADKDPFAVANSYPLWLLVDRFQRYDVRAQRRAHTASLLPPPAPPAEEPDEATMNLMRTATPWSR